MLCWCHVANAAVPDPGINFPTGPIRVASPASSCHDEAVCTLRCPSIYLKYRTEARRRPPRASYHSRPTQFVRTPNLRQESFFAPTMSGIGGPLWLSFLLQSYVNDAIPLEGGLVAVGVSLSVHRDPRLRASLPHHCCCHPAPSPATRATASNSSVCSRPPLA